MQSVEKAPKGTNPKAIPSIQELAKRVMEKKPKKKRKRYDIIPYEKRVALLELIIKEKETIKSASQKMGIKLCTTKHILYLYKNHGKIHQRREDHQISQEDEENGTQMQEEVRREPEIPEKIEMKKSFEVYQNQNKTEPRSTDSEPRTPEFSQNNEPIGPIEHLNKDSPAFPSNDFFKPDADINQLSMLFMQNQMALIQCMNTANQEGSFSGWPWNFSI